MGKHPQRNRPSTLGLQASNRRPASSTSSKHAKQPSHIFIELVSCTKMTFHNLKRPQSASKSVLDDHLEQNSHINSKLLGPSDAKWVNDSALSRGRDE